MSLFRRRLMMTKGDGSNLPNYLYFTALEDNSTIAKTGTYTPSLEYSLDGKNWDTFDNSITVSLNTGEIAYFRGNNIRLATSASNCTTFVMSGKIAAGGNVMSLLYEDDFDSQLSVQSNAFVALFKNCSALLTPPDVPATTNLGWNSYQSMFENCTSLTKAPDLPISSFQRGCCTSMFYGCSSLLYAPSINVNNADSGCMTNMFCGCTSMISASNIQIDCDTSGYDCFASMFKNCTALITPPSKIKLNNGSANSAFKDMFNGCSSLKSIPPINITVATNSIMQAMFNSCTNIEGEVDLSMVNSMSGTYQCKDAFKGCSKITKAILPLVSQVPASAYQDMFKGCSMLSYVMMLSISIASNWSLSGWLNNVSSNGILVKHIDATWTGNVPSNWTVIYYVPSEDKYYTDQTKATECDDHGNPI